MPAQPCTPSALGIDPGHIAGGAVLLEPSTKAPHVVLGAWAWRRVGQEPRYVVETSAGGVATVEHLHEVGRYVAAGVSALATRYVVTLEGLYVDDLKKAPSLLTLAEAAGEVVGPCRWGQVGDTVRPKASTWRGKVLRLGGVGAKAAAARAIQCAPFIATGLGALADNEHACEALCLAYYGMVVRS